MRELVVKDNYLELKGFEELEGVNELTFAILSNGIVIKRGNDNNKNHYCVKYKKGIIENTSLIEKIKERKFPNKIYFTKVVDRFLSEI